jgi:hypothetical protein
MPTLEQELLKSPTMRVDGKEPVIESPKYSDEEELYLKNLRKRMEFAKNARDTQHDELDGMDYVSHYDLNEKLANTFIKPKQNKEDTNFQSGTIREKLFALLSALVNLNLSGDISAFDDQGLVIQGMGDAMEDIIEKTDELDMDDDKKLRRQYELLKHGTVFVEEIWDERSKKSKKALRKFDGKLGGDWGGRIKKAFSRPARNIIPGPNVYLGDISKYDMSDQPYVFTVDRKPYEEAKLIFGQWERWPNVPRRIVQSNDVITNNSNIVDPNWRLLEKEDEYVEIIRYQDQWNNEFAVLLNGVLATPVGLPLPWGYEGYNIAQQNLEPIHDKYAYGSSLVKRIRTKVAVFDEMMRLAILKTQKSFMPPYINLSGRILSSRVFMPGKITHGIPKDSLVPISELETRGVTQSELAMIKEIKDSINAETTSPTFSGQQAEGNPTATEIVELQRQAKMILGLTVFAMAMLEYKLEWLRLQNILANWFKGDQVVDTARGVLRDKFRVVSLDKPIEGEGMGRRIVIPTKEIPGGPAILKAEKALSREQGVPIRLVFINPAEVASSKLVWQIVVRPKEKKTSETEKLLFRAFMADAIVLGPDINYLREKFAGAWGEDPRKLFPPEASAGASPLGQQGQQGGQRGGQVSPRVNLPGTPTAENALRQNLRTSIGANA